MGYCRATRHAIFAFLLVGGISAARADTVVVEELTATQFAAIFGSPVPTFNGITLPASPNNFVSETTLTLGPVTYTDTDGNLTAIGTGNGFDIGTTPDTLLVDDDDTSGNDINMAFTNPVSGIGLIAGDAQATAADFTTMPPTYYDTAIFNVTFGDMGVVSDIGGDGSLTMAGGTTPTYFGIFDTDGTTISQLNFSDSAGFPSLDTVTTTPEPNSMWLLAISILALLGIYSIVRKRKNVAAHLSWGATPLAVLAVFAILAVPSRSFAQPVNCNLAVPNNPLTAAGLATPYILSGSTGCTQAGATMAFVQAAIYSKNAHTISVYTPLVADAPASTPGVLKTPRYAISPVVPTLPSDAVVAIWFGYNFDNLTLTGTAVTNGTCFTGFGQFAACNATAFWTAVDADTTLLTNIYNTFKGQNGSDGVACPTSRSFSIVDQDPNDNLPVSFLLTSDNRVAQNTPANVAKLTSESLSPQVQINPSDEAVVDIFIDGALSCNPPVVADLTVPGTTHASYAVNELFAGLQSGQFPAVNSTSIYGNTPNPLIGPGVVAIGDTFTLTPTFQQPNAVATNCNINPADGDCVYPYTNSPNTDLTAFNAYVAAMGYSGATSGTISGTLSCAPGSAFARTNLYRAAANQPLADCTATQNALGAPGDASVQTFCKNMFTRTGVGDNSPADLLFNKDLTYFNQATNGPGGGNLFIFLGDRFAASYDLLGCAAYFNQPNPVNLNNVNATTPPTTTVPAPPFYYPAVFPPVVQTSAVQ